MRHVAAFSLAIVAWGCGSETSLMGSPAHHVDGGVADVDAASQATIDLQSLAERVVADVEVLTGGELALAIVDLSSNRRASVHGDALHISASSAKAFWTASALHAVGVDAVRAHAEPVFEFSDNLEAGAIIDLVGPNLLNEWLWNHANMADTALTSWSFGKTRIADNSPRRLGNNNYTTANDAVHFLEVLANGSLLGNAESAALLSWMQTSPRQGFGGWAGAGLSESARSTYHHKAGWLPPGCCASNPNSLLDIGIVLDNDTHYAYAFLLRAGEWAAQEGAMPVIACRVHHAMRGEGDEECGQ